MSYTSEGILSQTCLAFGQGTGAVRVSQDACRALRDRYSPRIDADLIASWEHEAVQVLERIRSIGRTAAGRIAAEGRIEITAADFTASARRVEINSDTERCPPDPQAVSHSEESVSTTAESILDQVFVALGQGTGPVRVAHNACRAVRERYEPRIDDLLLHAWDNEAPQVLERIRAIGRCAATRAHEAGSTRITRPMILEAMQRVEIASGTAWCPSYPPTDPETRPPMLEAALAR